MKKVILSLLVTIAFATSCTKKNYTCTCNCSPTGGSSFTKTETISNATLSDANTQCTNFGKASVGGNGSYSCSVK